MSENLLPPLRPSTFAHFTKKAASPASAVPGISGSCDPRFPERPPHLILERVVDSSSAKACRAIHQLWSQDVLEVTRRVIRLEAALRLERQNVASLEDRVSDYEGKVQLFQEEIQAMRNEAHEERESMHQMLVQMQLPRGQSDLGLSDATNASISSGGSARFSPATPLALEDWDFTKVKEF